MDTLPLQIVHRRKRRNNYRFLNDDESNNWLVSIVVKQEGEAPLRPPARYRNIDVVGANSCWLADDM